MAFCHYKDTIMPKHDVTVSWEHDLPVRRIATSVAKWRRTLAQASRKRIQSTVLGLSTDWEGIEKYNLEPDRLKTLLSTVGRRNGLLPSEYRKRTPKRRRKRAGGLAGARRTNATDAGQQPYGPGSKARPAPAEQPWETFSQPDDHGLLAQVIRPAREGETGSHVHGPWAVVASLGKPKPQEELHFRTETDPRAMT